MKKTKQILTVLVLTLLIGGGASSAASTLTKTNVEKTVIFSIDPPLP